MKLRGNKVLIDLPIIEKSVLDLTPEIEEQIQKENIKKWNKLKVFSVGTETKDIKKGDEVYISRQGLEHGARIDIDGEIKLLVDDYQINIIW